MYIPQSHDTTHVYIVVTTHKHKVHNQIQSSYILISTLILTIITLTIHLRDLVKFLSIPFAESCSTHRLSLVFLQENKLSLFFTRLLLLYNISNPCLSVAALL